MAHQRGKEEFDRRIATTWRPTYCNDIGKQYSVAGFREPSSAVAAIDALDFMHAVDD